MAEINGPNLCIVALFGTTSLAFLTYHTFKFDGCRCLVPRRKEWFRALMIYMLFLSNVCLIVWASGWCYVKYQLGWVRLGPMGARPWPSSLFPSPFDRFNGPLTVLLGICYTLQASLNAQEGLYWYHLMRAVRRPQASKPWLGSKYYYAWIVISILVAAIQLSVPWIGDNSNLQVQLSKELLTGGGLEFIVLCAATVVVLKFPRFLKDVKASGAGPDVQIRLYTYHESNKIRNLFRISFTMPLLVLGADGITAAAPLNMNAIVSDLLCATTVGSLCIVMMLSIMLYLPRSAPSAVHNKVMVGQMPPHATQANQLASGFALMSLLREGGQWEGDTELDVLDKDEAPFATAEARGTSWNTGAEEKWHQVHDVPQVPHILDQFTSPIAVHSEPTPWGPVEIRIQVEREIHED